MEITTEQEWLACGNPYFLLLSQDEKISDRKRRLFGCACCRRIWDLLDTTCRKLVEVTERLIDGAAGAKEFDAARSAAHAAWDNLPTLPTDGLQGVEVLLPLFFRGRTDPRTWKRTTQETFDFFDEAHDAIRDNLALHLPYSAVFNATASIQRYGAMRPVGRADPIFAPDQARKARAGSPPDDATPWFAVLDAEEKEQTAIARDILGNPFRPVEVGPSWRTAPVIALAQAIYEARCFGDMPILADALEEVGCTNHAILTHCRQPGEHVRGCWALDLILGKS